MIAGRNSNGRHMAPSAFVEATTPNQDDHGIMIDVQIHAGHEPRRTPAARPA